MVFQSFNTSIKTNPNPSKKFDRLKLRQLLLSWARPSSRHLDHLKMLACPIGNEVNSGLEAQQKIDLFAGTQFRSHHGMAITITQIAEAAGVSTATVDRVLNNRPGVNQGTVERVRAVMQNLGAASPSRGRPRATPNYRFAFVLPAARRGFFDSVDRVIAQAAGEFRHQHITEVTHRLPNQDGADFAAELAKFTDFDGIALLAPDVPQVKLAINELARSG